MNKLIFISIIFVSIPLFASQDEVPLVGLDSDNQPIEVFINKKEYQGRLGRMISSVQESTLPVLTKRDPRQGWSLRTVMVGIGVSMEVGISKIFKLGAIPRFKVAFTNSSDPGLP